MKLLSDLYGHEMKPFSYIFLDYLCFLTLKKFYMLVELVKPYIQLISFPNLKVLKTCLLSTHSCYDNMSPWITFEVYGLMDTSETSVQRIFNGWLIFWQLFLTLYLIPADGYRCTKYRTRSLFSDISRINIWFGYYMESLWYWNSLNKVL